MSLTLESTAMSTKERSALATRHFYEALGLGVVAPKNLPYLTIALTEAAAEEIRRNEGLRERIQSLYQELLPPTKKTKPRTDSATPREPGKSASRPRRKASLAPGAAPDLDTLARLFPASEWPSVLSQYSKDSLKKAVALVQEEHPGTKPASTSTKESLVAYLLQYMPRLP